jgi:alkylation response protein AidB-like acyl-CoA dehydrogenase
LPQVTDPDLEAFRAAAAAWLEENHPRSLRGAPDPTRREAGYQLTEDERLWKHRMANRGWGAPTWPTVYGGGGRSPIEGQVLQQEMARIGAHNPMGGMGLLMLGPTLLEFASEAQKACHLPPIARGEIRWCQGFSEPGAGSDLASLQTRAIDHGDHFVVSGQKTWTSGAQYADWCFCLVRTDTSRKHDGISFLLFDMSSPGIEIRPIQLISGASPFCETFLTDVVVPRGNLVGPLNGGWTIGKRLLQHERTGISGLVRNRAAEVSLVDLARRHVGVDENGHIADPVLRARIVANDMEARVFQLTAERVRREARSGVQGGGSSILKNAGTNLGQERDELRLEILGMAGLGWTGDGFDEAELEAVRKWLAGKATTIYGGSQEVQNNIISKRILDLPEGRRD